MKNKIYVIGHKSPDLDSVAAAIAFARLKNKKEEFSDFEAVAAGELNGETKYVLEKFGFKPLDIMKDVSGKQVVLVDHNEFLQAADGIENAKICEVLDHHKLNFQYSEPITVNIKPWGSSCSIVFEEYEKNGMEVGKELAGIMLAAILIDTVITKSPTCTEKDKEAIQRLSEISGMKDWKSFGMEIFKERSRVGELSAVEIIKSDFKDFQFKAGKFGIGQVETVDIKEFAGREDEFLSKLEEMKIGGGYEAAILFITDILDEGSEFFVAAEQKEKIGKALGGEFTGKTLYIKGILSRKKQVVPFLSEVFDK